MSDKPTQDYPQKKKNDYTSSDNTRIALQFLIIIVGAIAGNAGYGIVTEIANSIIEMRPAVINPPEVVIFLIFSALVISLLRLVLQSSQDDLTLEKADEIIQELEDSKINRRSEPESIIEELRHENEVLKRRLAEFDSDFDDSDRQQDQQ